jgi:N-methylhydantoinase A/oxoprolinase/acetone carboxylase beta subunit
LLGYAGDYPWKAVCTVPHAGAFSAWGGACMDYSHRRHKSVGAVITPDLEDDTKLQFMQPISTTWKDLESELRKELLGEGFSEDQISISRVVYMKYYGQLDDVEVESPVESVVTIDDMNTLFQSFEDIYAKMFTMAAKPDVPAFHITEVCVVAKVATVKPKLQKYELAGKKPAKKAFKCVRPVYMRGAWQDADIWEMESLVPGNEIDGLAVIEATNTTLFVPPEWHVRIDESDIYWITRKDA